MPRILLKQNLSTESATYTARLNPMSLFPSQHLRKAPGRRASLRSALAPATYFAPSTPHLDISITRYAQLHSNLNPPMTPEMDTDHRYPIPS